MPCPAERRIDTRLDKVFQVVVVSELFGPVSAVARNISTGGMFVEMVELLPLASVVTVHLATPDGTGPVVARAEVKHHYCLNFHRNGEPTSLRGMGLRFLSVERDSDAELHDTTDRERTLH